MAKRLDLDDGVRVAIRVFEVGIAGEGERVGGVEGAVEAGEGVVIGGNIEETTELERDEDEIEGGGGEDEVVELPSPTRYGF